MAALRGSWRMSRLLRSHCLHRRQFSNSRVVLAEWNKDWKPGPYPKTPEERAAAAKKYGMLPEDYEPYPDDGMGFGDYPKLPDIGDEAKDPFSDWDDPTMYRNYGEPVNIRWEQMTADRGDPSWRPRFTKFQMAMSFLSLMVGACGLWLLSIPYSPFQPMFPKSQPYDEVYLSTDDGKLHGTGQRVKHYTFEPAE